METNNGIRLTSILVPNKEETGFMLDVYKEIETKQLYERIKSGERNNKIEQTHKLKEVA